MGWVPSFYVHCLLVWGTTSFAILIVHPSGITQWITHGQDNDKKNNLTSIPKVIKEPKVSVIQKYSGIMPFSWGSSPWISFLYTHQRIKPPIIPEGPWTLLFRPPGPTSKALQTLRVGWGLEGLEAFPSSLVHLEVMPVGVPNTFHHPIWQKWLRDVTGDESNCRYKTLNQHISDLQLNPLRQCKMTENDIVSVLW